MLDGWYNVQEEGTEELHHTCGKEEFEEVEGWEKRGRIEMMEIKTATIAAGRVLLCCSVLDVNRIA